VATLEGGSCVCVAEFYRARYSLAQKRSSGKRSSRLGAGFGGVRVEWGFVGGGSEKVGRDLETSFGSR
jgi:hypothetical protein